MQPLRPPQPTSGGAPPRAAVSGCSGGSPGEGDEDLASGDDGASDEDSASNAAIHHTHAMTGEATGTGNSLPRTPGVTEARRLTGPPLAVGYHPTTPHGVRGIGTVTFFLVVPHGECLVLVLVFIARGGGRTSREAGVSVGGDSDRGRGGGDSAPQRVPSGGDVHGAMGPAHEPPTPASTALDPFYEVAAAAEAQMVDQLLEVPLLVSGQTAYPVEHEQLGGLSPDSVERSSVAPVGMFTTGAPSTGSSRNRSSLDFTTRRTGTPAHGGQGAPAVGTPPDDEDGEMSWRPHLDAIDTTHHARPSRRPLPPPPGIGAALLIDESVQQRLSAAAPCDQRAAAAAAGDQTTAPDCPPDCPQCRHRHNPPSPGTPPGPQTPLEALAQWATYGLVMCLMAHVVAAAAAGNTPPTPATLPPVGAAAVADPPPRALGRAAVPLAEGSPAPRAADGVAVYSTSTAAVGRSATPAAPPSASTSSKTTVSAVRSRRGTETRRSSRDGAADGDHAEH